MTSPVAPPAQHCYIHPDRAAGSLCRRCNQPICPDCMREAPVGWQCTRCVRKGARTSPTVRWRPGPPGGAGRLGNTRMTPIVIALIAVNVVVFLWEQTNFNNIVDRFAIVGFEIHSQHQWYRLITGAFLHENITHILLNMFTLAIVGPPVEAELGKGRFIGLYWASAIGGSVGAYLLTAPNVAGLGASGAIFGLMGAYFALARRQHWDVSTIGGLIVINLIFSFADPGISWQAHVGGLVTGAIVGFGLSHTQDLRRSSSPAVEAVASVAVVVAATAVLALLLLLSPDVL